MGSEKRFFTMQSGYQIDGGIQDAGCTRLLLMGVKSMDDLLLHNNIPLPPTYPLPLNPYKMSVTNPYAW